MIEHCSAKFQFHSHCPMPPRSTGFHHGHPVDALNNRKRYKTAKDSPNFLSAGRHFITDRALPHAFLCTFYCTFLVCKMTNLASCSVFVTYVTYAVKRANLSSKNIHYTYLSSLKLPFPQLSASIKFGIVSFKLENGTSARLCARTAQYLALIKHIRNIY